MTTTKIITIDGPVASGKGTIASKLAQRLDWNYLDSGALYRLVALDALNKEVSWQDQKQLVDLASNLEVSFQNAEIFLSGKNVTELIRDEKVGMGASQVATIVEVRQALLNKQRSFADNRNLVADGRDMGTVIFPNAQLKVFLTASAEVRAKRRANQLHETNPKMIRQIQLDIKQRDEQDKTRKISPLMPAPDAKLLDSSNLNVEETIKIIMIWYQQLNTL